MEWKKQILILFLILGALVSGVLLIKDTKYSKSFKLARRLDFLISGKLPISDSILCYRCTSETNSSTSLPYHPNCKSAKNLPQSTLQICKFNVTFNGYFFATEVGRPGCGKWAGAGIVRRNCVPQTWEELTDNDRMMPTLDTKLEFCFEHRCNGTWEGLRWLWHLSQGLFYLWLIVTVYMLVRRWC